MTTPPVPTAEDSPFTPAELKQFDADDVKAGNVICKILSLFFLYTVLAMAGAGYATYHWIMNPTIQ
jgi:hypothetical protein